MTEQEILQNLGRGKDIRGKKFNNLTPLYPLKERKFQSLVWHCKCICGNEVNVTYNHLYTGHTKSCGCLQREKTSKTNRKNEIGNKYGQLKVLKYYGNTKYQQALWECQCDCGNITIVSGADLRNGHTQSCGCLNSSVEKKIIQILKENNIFYQYQKVFPQCKYIDTNYNAIFDFYLPDYNCVIEYDGEQHYQPVRFSNISLEQAKYNLEKIKDHDQYKDKWCIEKCIKIVRIPYWDKEKIDFNYILNNIK